MLLVCADDDGEAILFEGQAAKRLLGGRSARRRNSNWWVLEVDVGVKQIGYRLRSMAKNENTIGRSQRKQVW